jgi:N-acetylglutamate synthase-like GNAT family acetyltransferase
MYVRDARNRDEVWLLDHIEAMGLDETAFRSRDYVIAVDEESNAKAGFGRIRIHKDEEEEILELTSIGVLEGWRGNGVGAHVIERLLEKAGDEGFETVYALTSSHDYLARFGFEAIDADTLPAKLRDRLAQKRESLDPEALPMRIDVGAFEMPTDLRERFKVAAEQQEEPEPEETPEDFGIDPDEATYKYDTGR